MKLDEEKLKELSRLSDAALWEQVRRFAGEKGFSLPQKTPSAADMAKLRAILLTPEKIRLTDAVRLMNEYKKKYGEDR